MNTNSYSSRFFISSLTLLAAIALFFLPFIKIVSPTNTQHSIYLFGLGLIGNENSIRQIAWGMDIQYTLLCLLATCSFFTLLTGGKAKLFFLSSSIFLITVLPVWIMAFTEGFLRPVIGSDIQISYSAAWFALALALGSATFSFLQTKEETYLGKSQASYYLLDQD